MGVSNSGSRSGQTSGMAPVKKNPYDMPTDPMVNDYPAKPGHTTPMVPSNPQPFNPEALNSMSGQMLGRQSSGFSQAPQLPGYSPNSQGMAPVSNGPVMSREQAGYQPYSPPQSAPQMPQMPQMPQGMNNGISLGLGQAPLLQPSAPQQQFGRRGMVPNRPPHLLY